MFRLSILVPVLALGCGSAPAADAPPSSPPLHAQPEDKGGSVCESIAKTCHPHDKDGGLAHECHLMGHHAESEAGCEARKQECLAACQ